MLDAHNAAEILRKTEQLKEPQKQYMNKTHYPGVYVISRKKQDKQMKLGEAHGNGGLYDRIRNQYKICMSINQGENLEFFLRYLIITPRERVGDKSRGKHYSQKMEKDLLNLLKAKEQIYEDSYSDEVLFTGDDGLEKSMFEILKKNKKYFTIAIKFADKYMYIYEEGNGFNTKALRFKDLPNLNPNVVNLLALHNHPLILNQKRIRKKIDYKRMNRGY